MIRSKKKAASKLLEQSQKAKGILYKTRESLLNVNSDMVDEAVVIQTEINNLEAERNALTSEVSSNEKVIKNIDKILDI